MKKSQFDKNLKDDLQQYISKVDTNALWANIESEVDTVNKNKQKKNRFFIWIFCLGLFFLGGTFYLIKTIPNSSVVAIKSDISPPSTITSATAISKEKNKNISIVDNPNTSNSFVNKGNETSQKNIFQKSIHKNISSKNNAITIQPIKYFSPSENKKIDHTTIQNIPTEEKKKEKIASSKNIHKTPILASSTFLLKNESTLPIQLLDENWDFAVSELNRNLSSNQKKPLQFSVGIQGGISSTSRGLLSNQPETIDYINLRKETEKALETIHFGALLNVTHHSGLELSSGLQWTSINEKFEFEGSRIEKDTIEDGLFGYFINPNGDTIPVYDQVINQQEIFYNKKTYNKYRMIGIPILLGYHQRNGNWSLGIVGGVIANISLKTSGHMFNPEGEIIDIEEKQQKVFHSKIGLNYSLAFSGKYFITDHLQITINPTFRFFPKSFTLSDFPLNQKYYLLGGNVGLRYSF